MASANQTVTFTLKAVDDKGRSIPQPFRVEQSTKAKARDILTLAGAVSLSILAVCGALILARALWRLTA